MYRKCPDCGCSLDPGEKCDCGGKPLRREARQREPRVELRVESSGIKAVLYERAVK